MQKVGKSSLGLYFGIELEVEYEDGYDVEKLRQVVRKDFKDYMYDVGYDGSIRNGIEYRFNPMTYSTLQRTTFLDKFCKCIDSHGATSYDNPRCGMHVHVSREAFEPLHAKKYWQFFYRNPNFIKFVSRRRYDDLKQWANPRAFTAEQWESMAKDSDGFPRYNHNKYQAINIHSRHPTMEVRIFRGTLSPSGIRGNIQFLHSLYYFTKHHGQDNCELDTYLDWLSKQSEYTGANRLCNIERIAHKRKGHTKCA